MKAERERSLAKMCRKYNLHKINALASTSSTCASELGTLSRRTTPEGINGLETAGIGLSHYVDVVMQG